MKCIFANISAMDTNFNNEQTLDFRKQLHDFDPFVPGSCVTGFETQIKHFHLYSGVPNERF